MVSKGLVFITGASRGIGKALRKKFIEEDFEVIGTSTSGGDFLKLDLSSSESIKTCVKEFSEMNIRVDILINNAGIMVDYGKNFVDMGNLRKTLEVNLIGTIDFTERMASFLNKGARIINISSSAGSLTKSNYSDYPSYKISKAALNMYSRVLGASLKDGGFLVASIHPGWVKTDMGGMNADLKPEESAEEIFKRIISFKETGKFWFEMNEFPW